MANDLTIVGFVCKNNKGRIIYSMGRRVRDIPVLIAEAIVVREALIIAAQLNMNNLFMESGPPIVINSILGKITVPRQIVNLITAIAIWHRSLVKFNLLL